MTINAAFENFLSERNDLVYNAVYNLILTITGKTEDELPWDMSIIGDVTDVIEMTLDRHGIYFCYPSHNIGADDDEEKPCYLDMDCQCVQCPMKADKSKGEETMKFFEMFIRNPVDADDEANEVAMCGKGVRIPTAEEANVFYMEDIESFYNGWPIVAVYELSAEEAERFYDMTGVGNWPTFGL